jgi:hypothetical protein
MYSASATIRDYDPTTDTCSVELIGIGVIDTWLEGVAIAVGINRHFIAAGVVCTVMMPDAHRLCETTVTALALDPSLATTQYNPAPAGSLQLQSVRVPVPTDGTGHGVASITWPIPFTAAPTVSAYADTGAAVAISAVTTTGCTITISSGPLNSTLYVSATASGA